MAISSPSSSEDGTGSGSEARNQPPWLRLLHRRTQLLLDVGTLAGAFVLAYLFRFDFVVPEAWVERGLIQLPLVLLVQMLALTVAGVYAFVWRYVGLRELGTFLRAAAYWTAPLLLLRLWPGIDDPWLMPWSVIAMDAILAFGGLLALRVVRRVVYEEFERDSRQRGERGKRRKRTLLIGAGRAGVLAAREVQGRGDTDLEIVGFVDDDPLKQRMTIHGSRVLGTTRDVPRLARELSLDQAVITIAEAEPPVIRRLVELCERTGLAVRTIPGLYEILQGHVAISRFRDIAMEDLLRRDPVRLDESLLERFLSGRKVMVTGAGGSIGSELARQVARFAPAHLLVVERAEFALFEVDRKLRRLWPDLDVVPLVGDVCDPGRMREIFEQGRPDVVFHAAAHKHVPLMETNVGEAVRNNVLGTATLGRLAGEFGVGSFVLVSTDKAVRPTSVMGASKRLAELTAQHLDARFPDTRFVAVRFGNVLGSAGSVIEIFREQIEAGGPVTVTHPEMTRYFMTIPEAAQLVLQAGAMGEGAEGGEIFVLDMGRPVKIVELARELIHLSGRTPGEGIEIVFSGMRPGEKLFEELSLDTEAAEKTRHPKIFIGRLESSPPETMERALERLAELVANGDSEGLREYMERLVPEARLGGRSPGELRSERDERSDDLAG